MRFVRCKTTRYGRNRPRCAELVQSATVRDVLPIVALSRRSQLPVIHPPGN